MTLDEWFADVRNRVMNIERMLMILTGEDSGDLPTEEEERVAGRIQAVIGEPRPAGQRYEMVKDASGQEVRLAWSDIEDDRIKEAIKISKEVGQPYQLYYDPDHNLRISVSQQVVQRMQAG